MKIASLTKLLAIFIAASGLIVGCAGSETKEEAPAEQAAQPAQEATTDTSAATTDTAATTESTAEASTDDAAAMHSSASSDTYEVTGGDNLWNISGKSEIYADPYQWPLIYKANRSQIQDADLIYPGQVFDIDRAASQADIDAAVDHAKTRGAWSLGQQEASDKAYLGE